MSGLAAPGPGEAAAARHLIHRLELEIHTSEKTLAEALLPRLSRLHHDRLVPLLERICDHVSPGGRLHRLQTIELDLGPLALEQLEDQFTERLAEALRQALAKHLGPAVAEDSVSQAASTPAPRAIGADRDLIIHYAATGNLPWWAPRDQPGVVAETLARWLQTSAAPLLEELATLPHGLNRLRRAVNPSQRPLLEAAIAALPPPHGSHPPVGGPSEEPWPEPPIEANDPLKDAGPKTAPHAQAERLHPHPAPSRPRPPLPLELPTAQRLAPPHADPPSRLHPASASQPLASGRKAAGGEPWPIDGAGLVLLWPFLETLCRRLQLLGDDRQFRGEAERQRAIALLGWLVDDQQELLEWRLTLAKVLCGASPDHPWELAAPMGEQELRELRGLLAAALAHASGRLGATVEELRQGLLQRPGLLLRQPIGWLLQLERLEGDAVLSDLPWEIQWLRLPWMDDGLQVIW